MIRQAVAEAANAFVGTGLAEVVLIVDDDNEVAETCALVLKKAGLDCSLANDSPAALDLFDSRPPELVLCDINLPSSDGFEVARRVRQKSPETPVILMTTQDRNHTREKAAQAGAAGFLGKPFSNADLIRTVTSILGENCSLPT